MGNLHHFSLSWNATQSLLFGSNAAERPSCYDGAAIIIHGPRARLGCLPADQVEDRIEEHPDHVDEMPVLDAGLHAPVAVLREVSSTDQTIDQGEHDDAADDVGGMEPGH